VEELKNVKNREYEGQIAKGVRAGIGQLVYPNGDVYRGNFKHNERNGQGTCIFAMTG
jgi:hypothetical protein